jgi:hypothetical protein
LSGAARVQPAAARAKSMATRPCSGNERRYEYVSIIIIIIYDSASNQPLGWPFVQFQSLCSTESFPNNSFARGIIHIYISFAFDAQCALTGRGETTLMLWIGDWLFTDVIRQCGQPIFLRYLTCLWIFEMVDSDARIFIAENKWCVFEHWWESPPNRRRWVFVNQHTKFQDLLDWKPNVLGF